MEPRFIFLVGIPGCGKSTMIAGCKNSRDIVVVSPDIIRKETYGDVTEQSHNMEVWAEAKFKTMEYLSKGVSVILDATNVNTTNRRNFIQGLPSCKLQAILFKVDPQICWERIRKDIENGKDRAKVPEEVIYRMYGEYLYTEKVIESEGFEIITSI